MLNKTHSALREDLPVPILALLLSAGLVLFTAGKGLFSDGEPSPWFAAFVCALGLGSASLVMLVQILSPAIRPTRKILVGDPVESGSFSRRNLYICSFVLCCITIEITGIYFAVPVTLAFLLKVAERRSWTAAILISVTSLILLELIFYRLLGVELEPGGLLGYVRRFAGWGY